MEASHPKGTSVTRSVLTRMVGATNFMWIQIRLRHLSGWNPDPEANILQAKFTIIIPVVAEY